MQYLEEKIQDMESVQKIILCDLRILSRLFEDKMLRSEQNTHMNIPGITMTMALMTVTIGNHTPAFLVVEFLDLLLPLFFTFRLPFLAALSVLFSFPILDKTVCTCSTYNFNKYALPCGTHFNFINKCKTPEFYLCVSLLVAVDHFQMKLVVPSQHPPRKG